MKQRLNFVSNSSSSSFTCDVCGRNESGYDMCLSECDMIETKWGICCQTEFDEFVKAKSLEDRVEKLQESEDWPYLDYIEGSEDVCPFHNLYYFKEKDLLDYLLKKAKMTKEDIQKELYNKYSDLEDLRKYTKAE